MEYYINDNNIRIVNIKDLKFKDIDEWLKSIRRRFICKTLQNNPNWILKIKLIIYKLLNKKEVLL